MRRQNGLFLLAASACIFLAGSNLFAAIKSVELRELTMLDARGVRCPLASSPRQAGTAFIFLSSECPISREYVPELNRLAKEAEAKNIRFYGVLSDRSIKRAEAVRFADEFKLAFPLLFDASQELAGLFGPTNVPEAFLVDPAGTVRYHGRIDDQYSDLDKKREQPRRRDLFEALRGAGCGPSHCSGRNRTCRLSLRERGGTDRQGGGHLFPRYRPHPVRTLCRVPSSGRSGPLFLAELSRRGQPGEGSGPRDEPPLDASLESRRALRAVSGRTATDRATDRVDKDLGRQRCAGRGRGRPSRRAKIRVWLETGHAGPCGRGAGPLHGPCRWSRYLSALCRPAQFDQGRDTGGIRVSPGQPLGGAPCDCSG